MLASSFALYRAQQRLVAAGKRCGFKLKIFHGRGGSIGRGGGPSQRAIEKLLPAGSIDGRFKLTEQGEVLGWKYLLDRDPPSATLEVTASGVLRATALHDTDADADAGAARPGGRLRGRRGREPADVPRAGPGSG